jgi:two-component system response regulator (stage 0 sporulation protein F)
MNRKKQAFLVKDGAKITSPKPYHILVAEDDYEMRVMLAFALRRAGYQVTECSDGAGLLTYLEAFLLPNGIGPKDLALIVSDICMPGFTGMEVLEGASEIEGFPPVILITAFGDEKTHALAEKFGAAAMFDKPFDMDDLLAKVHEVLQKANKKGSN